MAKPESPQDPRSYFAAERTLLAWIRTGLALMGFGFVVARFGLFLRELAVEQGAALPHTGSFSLLAGTSLVVLGVAANLLAALKHRRVIRRLKLGEPIDVDGWSLEIVIAIVLALLGVAIAIYLVWGLPSSR